MLDDLESSLELMNEIRGNWSRLEYLIKKLYSLITAHD